MANQGHYNRCIKLLYSGHFSCCFRYNPVREAEQMPTTDDIWKLLHSKIMNSFSSIKQAFLVFDDVGVQYMMLLTHFTLTSVCIISTLFSHNTSIAIKNSLSSKALPLSFIYLILILDSGLILLGVIDGSHQWETCLKIFILGESSATFNCESPSEHK